MSVSVSQSRAVSAIMVTYHTGPVLWRSIEEVLRQPEIEQLIIVNNGNPADSLKRLQHIEQQNARVSLISGHGNIGFAKACNLGAKQATLPYMLLINPDCIITQSACSRIIDVLEQSDDYWCGSGRILNHQGREQAGSRRNLLTPLVAFTESTRLDALIPALKAYRLNHHCTASPTQPEIVPAISGAFIMIKTARYQQIGGMDEEYFLHVEDLDFCLKIHQAGGKIMHVPDVNIPHFRSTSEVSSLTIERYKTESFIMYFNKHFKRNVVPGLRIMLNAAIYARYGLKATLYWLRKLKPTHLFAKRLTQATGNSQYQRKQLIESYRAMRSSDKPLTYNEVPLEILQSNGPVLVMGATGQAGLTIIRRLLAANIPVIAMYHQTVVNFEHPLLTWIYGNVASQQLELYNYVPKTVISTVNITQLAPLIPYFAAKHISRLVAFSSTSIVGKADSHHNYEQDLVQNFKSDEQEVSKLCEENDIACTIVRPTLIYGVGLDKNISHIVRFIHLFGRFPLIRPASGLRQPVHSDDLAKATLSLLNCPASFGKTYTLAGQEKLTYREMVERVFNEIGREPHILFMRSLPWCMDICAKLLRRPELNGEIARRMNKNLDYDISEAQHDFAYTPRAFLNAGIHDIHPDFAAEYIDYSLTGTSDNIVAFPNRESV